MPNFIEIGGGSRKFSKKLVDLTRNDPSVDLDIVTLVLPELPEAEHDGGVCVHAYD